MENEDMTGSDLLYGAAEIAEFLFGDSEHRRKVYHLAERGLIPVFKLNGTSICCRRSTLMDLISKMEEKSTGKNHGGH